MLTAIIDFFGASASTIIVLSKAEVEHSRKVYQQTYGTHIASTYVCLYWLNFDLKRLQTIHLHVLPSDPFCQLLLQGLYRHADVKLEPLKCNKIQLAIWNVT